LPFSTFFNTKFLPGERLPQEGDRIFCVLFLIFPPAQGSGFLLRFTGGLRGLGEGIFIGDENDSAAGVDSGPWQ